MVNMVNELVTDDENTVNNTENYIGSEIHINHPGNWLLKIH